MDSAATTAGFTPAPKCACEFACGDIEEADDDPRAVCKGLPVAYVAPVEIVLEPKAKS